MSVPETTIFSSSTYKVDYFPPLDAQDAIAITFSERTNRNLEGLGFGGGFMLKLRCGLIAVKGCQDVWYHDFPQEAVDAIIAFLHRSGFDRLPRVTYGTSMGGYAALAFSKALVADAVLGISPLADPFVHWEGRWQQDRVEGFRSLKDIGLLPTTRIVVAYDPFDPDSRHATMIEQLAGDRFEAVRVPFAGHPVGRALHDANCLKDLAIAVFRGDPLPNGHMKIMEKRREYIHYPFVLAFQCRQRKRPNWAEAMVKVALRRNIVDAEYNILASSLAEQLGRPDDALRYAATAVTVKPEHISSLACLAHILSKVGSHDIALTWLDKAIELRPDLDYLRHQRDRIVSASASA